MFSMEKAQCNEFWRQVSEGFPPASGSSFEDFSSPQVKESSFNIRGELKRPLDDKTLIYQMAAPKNAPLIVDGLLIAFGYAARQPAGLVVHVSGNHFDSLLLGVAMEIVTASESVKEFANRFASRGLFQRINGMVVEWRDKFTQPNTAPPVASAKTGATQKSRFLAGERRPQGASLPQLLEDALATQVLRCLVSPVDDVLGLSEPAYTALRTAIREKRIGRITIPNGDQQEWQSLKTIFQNVGVSPIDARTQSKAMPIEPWLPSVQESVEPFLSRLHNLTTQDFEDMNRAQHEAFVIWAAKLVVLSNGGSAASGMSKLFVDSLRSLYARYFVEGYKEERVEQVVEFSGVTPITLGALSSSHNNMRQTRLLSVLGKMESGDMDTDRAGLTVYNPQSVAKHLCKLRLPHLHVDETLFSSAPLETIPVGTRKPANPFQRFIR